MDNDSAKLDIARLFNDRIPAAVSALAENVIASCEKYVPYRTGWLMRSCQVEDSTSFSKKVVYTASYASECYYATHPFSKKRHPLATARWFEAGKNECIGEWRKTVAEKLTAQL